MTVPCERLLTKVERCRNIHKRCIHLFARSSLVFGAWTIVGDLYEERMGADGSALLIISLHLLSRARGLEHRAQNDETFSSFPTEKRGTAGSDRSKAFEEIMSALSLIERALPDETRMEKGSDLTTLLIVSLFLGLEYIEDGC